MILSIIKKVLAPGKRHEGIQCLRGICVIIVFFSHALNFFQIPYVSEIIKSPLHLFFDGQCAVIVFFVLSGFYYYSERSLTLVEYAKGVYKKAIKIAPPYILSLIFGYIICNTFLHFGIGESNDGLTEWGFCFLA